MVADHITISATVYRAAAAHKVQVRSLTAAWMIGMGARYPNESTGSNAHAKLNTRRSPWPDPRGVRSVDPWTWRPPLVNSIST
jgi:hypothetical protein